MTFICIICLLAACFVVTASSLSTNSPCDALFQNARPELLNLLNHPLQLQLATGALQLGAFQRLIHDRKTILDGLDAATNGMPQIKEELRLHETEAAGWLAAAEEDGKTIKVSGIKCFNCGGDHLNIDCPEDQETSSSAQALKSLLQANGLAGAAAVLQAYSFSCKTLLKACEADKLELNPVYHEWLQVHAKRWTEYGQICAQMMKGTNHQHGYTACLSMLYNWIDAEAATTGIRADLNEPTLSALMDELEHLEPGYATQRDKHESFVADITGVKFAQDLEKKVMSKVDKAAAYLAAKKSKNAKLDAAAAYLAAKKKKEGRG